MQLHSDLVGLSLLAVVGVNTGLGVDDTIMGAVLGQGPCKTFRKVCFSAPLVRTDGGKRHLRAGGIHVIHRADGRMVELVVAVAGGDQQQGTGDRPLDAVAGAVLHLQGVGALSAGAYGSGTAAVQIQGIDTACLLEQLSLFIHGHTHRVTLPTVCLEQDHFPLCRHTHALHRDQAAVLRHRDLSVLHQEEGAADGLLYVAGILACVTDGVFAVLEHRKIRLIGGAQIAVALHDQVAQGLAGGHVEIVTVDSGDDRLLGVGSRFICLSLIHDRSHAPVVRTPVLRDLLSRCRRVAVLIVARVARLEGHVAVGLDGDHMPLDIAVGAVAHIDLGLHDPFGQGILGLTEDLDLLCRGDRFRLRRNILLRSRLRLCRCRSVLSRLLVRLFRSRFLVRRLFFRRFLLRRGRRFLWFLFCRFLSILVPFRILRLRFFRRHC